MMPESILKGQGYKKRAAVFKKKVGSWLSASLSHLVQRNRIIFPQIPFFKKYLTLKTVNCFHSQIPAYSMNN
jgi:hypothetical protein